MKGFINREKLSNAIQERLEQYGYEKGMSPEKHHSYMSVRKVINVRLYGILKNYKELVEDTFDKAIKILDEVLPPKVQPEIKKVKCDKCIRMKIDMKSVSELIPTCGVNKQDLSNVDLETFEVECDAYKSKYIEYPISVSNIELPKDGGITDGWRHKKGTLVKVRPCDDKYNKKTYLGFLLGDADIQLFVSHNPETGELRITRHYNPAIFVPEINEIIYGCGSWWGEIKNEEELKEITDSDIENVWYVKAWKKMKEAEEKE